MARKPWKLPPFKVEAVLTATSEMMDWGLTLFGIPDAWRESGEGDGIRGCVLDTGAPQHPDLEGAIAGYEDFTGQGPADGNGHSTHCCGIIGARQNQEGTVGVMPKCQIYTGKVLDNSGSGSIEQIIEGIYWAIKLRPDFISMSLGSSQDDARMRKALQEAVGAGIPVICASGNEGPGPDTMGYPGQYPFVIGVGAVDEHRQLASFSSRGAGMDICGPGVNILSTYLRGRYAKLSGTSMATPFVAAVVGLFIAYRKKKGLKPLTPAEILRDIDRSATDAGPPGFDTGFGFGLVSPSEFLQQDQAPPPVLPPLTGAPWLDIDASHVPGVPAIAKGLGIEGLRILFDKPAA